MVVQLSDQRIICCLAAAEARGKPRGGGGKQIHRADGADESPSAAVKIGAEPGSSAPENLEISHSAKESRL
jgi:hypothetical protein